MEITFGADQPAVGRLVDQFAGIGRLGVAFSGGVDSAAPARAGRARARRRPGRRAPRGVAEPGRRRTRRGARGRPPHRRPGGRGRHPRGRPPRLPGQRARTAASTARTSCSRRIDDEVAAAHRLDAVAYGENADDARRPGPAGRPRGRPTTGCCGRSPTRAWTRPRCGGSPGRWPAVRRQARRAVPGLPHPAPPARDARRSCARSSGGSGRCARSASPTAGAAPRRRRPDRAAGR